MSETEIEEMFDVADTDRDGIIGYPEFMVRYVQIQIKYNYKAKYNQKYGTKYESCRSPDDAESAKDIGKAASGEPHSAH